MSRLRSIVSQANQRLSVRSAAFLLSGSMLLSSLLGLYRDRLLNSMYYEHYKVGIDAYTAAFKVPDFMFIILVSGALSVTFIPIFNQRLATGNKKSAWELSTSMVNFMALLTLIASILIMIFAPVLVDYVVGAGFEESSRMLATSMMRVIALNPFLFSIATVISSMQQAVGRYTIYALAPAIYNIGIVIGALFFTNGISIFGVQIFEGGIMGVALGVVLGSVMQLFVSIIGLVGLGFDYDFKIYWKNKGFRKALRLLPARSADQGMDYTVGLVEANLTSHMEAGTVRAYQQASVLHAMPINLIGVAISNAAFPQMTEQLGSGDIRAFRTELQKVVRVIIWLALPVATIAYFGRGYVVSFIMNGGDPLTASILGAFTLAILFRSIYHIAARSFYAQQDTKTPLYISIFSIALNIFLAIALSMWLHWGPIGLAVAQSIVAMVEVIILFIIIQKRMPGGFFDKKIVSGLVRMLSATGFTAIVCYFMVQLLQLQRNDMSLSQTVPKFIIITVVSFAVYTSICVLFRLPEPKPITKKLKQILFSGVGSK